MHRLSCSLKPLRLTFVGMAIAIMIFTEMMLPSRSKAAVVQPVRPVRLQLKAQRSLRSIARKLTVPFSRLHPLTPRRYVVRAGDCLSVIAARFGLSWQKVYADNRQVIGPDPDLIEAGQVLTIIGATQTPALAAPPAPRKAVHHAEVLAKVTSGACHARVGQAYERGMLPMNFISETDYLVDHGYTDNAAAGVVGNMWQESGGNPDAVGDGGGGLIGFTPFIPGKDGYIGDLFSQLAAVLRFNDGISGAREIDAHAYTPAAAAEYYMEVFERPAPATDGLGNREASADTIAAVCRF